MRWRPASTKAISGSEERLVQILRPGAESLATAAPDPVLSRLTTVSLVCKRIVWHRAGTQRSEAKATEIETARGRMKGGTLFCYPNVGIQPLGRINHQMSGMLGVSTSSIAFLPYDCLWQAWMPRASGASSLSSKSLITRSMYANEGEGLFPTGC